MKSIRLLSIAAAMLGALSASAAPLTPEASLQRALGSDVCRKVPMSSHSYSLALIQSYEADGPARVYVFEDEDSFIVTAADDCVPVLLGYGDTPLKDADGRTAPCFDYWISELARQIDYGVSEQAYAPMNARPYREPIYPLCLTQWNQDSPYNDLCPKKNGSRCVTGCAATSTAQVMKYHNWPDRGVGSVTYSWNSSNLSINLAQTTFDWTNMLNSYANSSGNTTERNAVAVLMKAVGYAMNMNYEPDGSGAVSSNVAAALGYYLKYDKTLRFLSRDWYSLANWEELVYNSLKQYGPIVYNGQSQDGGHSFVCDGYSEDGYFHINWGWGGISDGYFRLNALDPSSQGIGGSTSAFNYDQDIICDIRPEETGQTQFTPVMALSGALEMEIDGTDLNIPSMVYNHGPSTMSLVWLAVTFSPINSSNEYTGDPRTRHGVKLEDLKANYGVKNIETSVDNLDDGRYLVTLQYTFDKEEWLPVITNYGKTNSFIMVKKGSSVTLQKHISGVGHVTADDADADAACEYYDMRGVKVAETPAGEQPQLTPGLYVRRQGTRATKILIK